MKKYILSSIILLLAAANTAWGQNVAKIGTTEYATLAAAIAAVPTDGTETTITMLNDVDISEGVEISGNKNVTLNLNGKEIKMNVATNVAVAVFNVTGTANLTVTDTPSGGKITAHNDNKEWTAVIENNGSGKVTVAGGTLSTSTNAKWGVAILVKSGSAEVSGGSVTGDYYGIRNYGSGTITVSGGTVSGVYGIRNDGNASTINISGGTVTASGPALSNAEGKSCTIEVSGGQFSEQVLPEYCAPGYIPTQTGEGTYSVGGPYVATITANNVTTGYETLANAITAAQAGETILLLNNITLTSTQTINKAVIIDGGNHTVTKADGNAFELTGSNNVTFTNLNINVTGASGRAIQAGNDSQSYSGSLTVTNSTLTAGQRGVSIYEPGGNINLAISNTTIQSAVAEPTTTYNPNDSRGVALWSYDGHSHNVTLENTTIKGFSYCINVGGTGKINDLTMTGGATYGRAAINNHGKNGTFNLTNVEIHGLNNQTGPTEAFACIVDDTDAANNTYNLDNCTIIATLSDAAVSAGGNASEYLVDLRGKDSNVYITNGTTFTTNNTDRGGLIQYYERLDTHLGNTINFDQATYEAFDADYDFANVEGLNTTGNTLTYTPEVYYYWTGQQAGGEYCSFEDPFIKGWLDNGEFIQLQRDVTLASDITCPLENGESFYLELNGNKIIQTQAANAILPPYIYLNEGVTVYTDVEIDGLLYGVNGCPIVKTANDDATYKYKYTVVADDYVAHINGTLYTSLTEAVAAAQAGQTIELLTDINLTDPQTINKEVTIDGGTNQYTITSTGNPAAIQIAGAGNITLKNLKVTNGVYNGVQISENANYSGKLTIDNCVITVGKRGVNVVGIASSFSMDITYSTIQSTVDDPTTTYLDDIDSRGISLSDNLQEFTTVNINNTIIQGFYDINAADTRKYLKLTMTGGKTYGRAAVNNYGDYNTFTLNGVEIHGLNNQTNPAQSFACIVDNTYATNNTYNIIGCTFTATISDAAINEDNSTASEQMLALRGTNAKVNITSNTTYTTTCTDKSRVGLLEDESRVADPTYNNIVTLDADALSSLTGVINDLTTLVAEYDGQSKYKLVPGSPSTVVAKIGDTEYTTLEEAFAAVQNGETITMLTDYTLATPMDLTLEGKVVTLDLGGKTLTGRTNLKSGNLTIQNGTVAGGEQQALNVYGSATAGTQNYSVLTIASNVTVTADQFGVCLFGPTYNSKPGYGAVINIAGTVHTTGTGAEGAVFVSGNLGNNIDGDMNNVINVTGTITSDTDAAIALNGNATVNVQDGAVITGNTAIAIKRGTLNVTGGTVHATGISQIPPSGNLNGTEMTGAAVSMTNTYNQYGAMQVNISGGSFTSDHAMALYKEDDTYTNTAKYAVSGGIFSTAVPEEFCADGYVPTSITTQGLTQYTVEPGDFVAQIGETKYTTLAAAVAAVPTNGLETTITLLKDITLVNNVVVGGTYGTTPKVTTAITNQNVILNLDGHTITGAKTLYLAGGSLNITGTGSIISTSQDVAPVGVRYVKTADYPDLDYTSKRTLTIGKNVTLTGAQYGLNIFGTNEASTANNIDVTVDGTVNGMLFVLGNISNANNNINIDVNGTVDATNATGSEMVKTGIALCGNASVHINDNAVVKGESGIEVRAGELIMDGDIGGTITATADYSYEANGSGTTTKGAAIAVAQHGTKIATSATILGGATLYGTKKIAVIDAQNNSLAGVTVIADDSFVTNTETVLPDGYYWLSNGDGTSSPAPNSAVAQIGNTLYSTLAAAVAAVPADGTPTTITLLQNINLTERLFVNAGATPVYAGSNNRYATTTENKNITLELDGHNIVSSSNIALAGGSLNITNNGTADATHGVISTTAGGLAPIEVRGTGDLTQKRTLTVGTGVTLTGAEYGLNIFGSNDQQKNIIDVNVDGTVNGILFVLGNLSNADNAINIVVNGTVDASGVTGTGEAIHSGIALGGNATVNVNNGATVKGESGIEVRAGNLTVNGGTIEATVADYSYTANNNGMTTKGAAIAVAQHSTVRPIDVTLNGGTLTGAKKIGVTDVNNNYLTDVSVVASNSFLTNAGTDTEIPAGFIWVDNGNNTKKLVLAPVRIGNVGYATLADALNAVLTGEIVKLYADVTLTADLSTNNTSCTFDFNNHNVIQNGYHVMLTEGVTVQTNVQTQLFAAAEGYVVVESNTSSTEYPYEYSVKMSLANAGITITVDPATYNGAAQVPNVTVKKNGETTPLVQGTDYTISYKGGNSNSHLVNADTYVEEIVISGKGNYGGKIYADFIINPRHINDVNYSGNSQLYIPAGYAVDNIKELIVLTYNSTTLTRTTDATNPKDYTVSVAAGPETGGKYITPGIYAGVITLTAEEGVGKNFVGTRTIDFIIGDAINIADCDITATTIYNGAAQDPTGTSGSANVVVKNGTTVVDPSNYVITYIGEGTPGYTNAGTYSIRVSAVSTSTTYYGSKDVEYVINPKSITSNDIVIVNETTFAGTTIDPVNVVQVKDNGIGDAGTSLVKGTDYNITTAGYTYQDPQTYPNALTITGIGNYTGTVVKDFIITPNNAINLASAAVVISKQTYTGADLKPTAATTTVTVNGTALSSDYYDFSFVPEGDNFYKDAKVYSNAIIITAKTTQTTYYGTAVGNYIIEPRDLSDAGITVTTTALNYLNTEQDVTVVVKYGNNEIPATNYTYTPTKVTEAGHYDITITAVENSNLVGSTTADQWVYKTLNGDYAADFTVEPDPIPTQTYTGSEIRPTIVVKDKDRVMQLVDANGGDYSVEYTNNINEGEATITITGRYAYSGTITKHFTIVKEYFTVGDFTYHHAKEGEEVNLGKKDGGNNVLATTKAGKVEVPETVDYQGKTFTVTGIEEKALGGADITAVVLPQSIAEIEDNAFQGAINTRYVDASAMSGYVPETLTRDFDGPFGGLPKQALVYLTGTNIKGENYVYKPGSGDAYYCELFKIYDDLNGSQTGFDGNDYKWAFENVHKFTAYTVENTRMLTAGKHYTTCLPYSIDIPRNVKAYTLDATSSQIFGFKEVETGTIAAYTPYVLIPSTSGQLLSATNVEVDRFPADATTDATKLNGVNPANSNFTFYGTMRYMEGADAAGKYIMQYKDNKSTWLSIDEGSAGFNESNRACILPMRAYIASTTSGARSFTATFTDIDGIIRTETFTLDDEDTVIYDLSGRRVELLEHGHTYIINGKKVIVK